VRLENETIRLDIQEPGEGYVGSRFDWTGKVTQVTFRGRRTFCTEETTDPEALHRGGRGLFNEFGIDEPVGYEDCAVGDVFLKPGVGRLTRVSDGPYDFLFPYPVDPGVTRWELDERSVSFEFHCAIPQGQAVTLRKRIALVGSGFSIDYALTNRGATPLRTNEYVHSFLAIDREPPGPAYRLTCSFPLTADGFSESVNPAEVVALRGDHALWTRVPDSPFFFGGLRPPPGEGASWQLEHGRRGLALRESVAFAPLRFNLWGTGHVVSPELVRRIEIAPGGTDRWSRAFRVTLAGEAPSPPRRARWPRRRTP
jgi:hypothetical protein